MLSEQMANGTIQLSKEGIRIVGKLTEETMKALLALISSIGTEIVDKGREKVNLLKQENENLKWGIIDFSEFIKKGFAMDMMNGLDKKDIPLIDELSQKWGMQYAILQDKSDKNKISVAYKIEDAYKAKNIFEEYIKIRSIEAVAEEKGLTTNQVTNIINQFEKNNPELHKKIVDKTNKQILIDNSNPLSIVSDTLENSEKWDKLWKESKFHDNKINNLLGSKKQNFISNLEDAIEGAIGRTNDNYVMIPGQGIVYLETGEINELTAISFDTVEAKTVVIDKQDLQEMKDLISKTNDREEFLKVQMSTKYKDYYPEQKEAILFGKRKGYDVSLYDLKDFDHKKMYSLISVQESGQSIIKYLKEDYSAEQILMLSMAAKLGIETKQFEDVNIGADKMQEIINEYREAKIDNRDVDLTEIDKILTSDKKNIIETSLENTIEEVAKIPNSIKNIAIVR